jgi:flavin reductase
VTALPRMDVGPGAVDPVDTRQLRRILGTFATGVTVVTVGGAYPHGMTANAFTSVSLRPPLVLVCINHDARMHQALAHSDTFALSVLATHQDGIARYFSDEQRPEGLAQFASVTWSRGVATGAPLIDGALAWFECLRHEVHRGGDHSIFVGRLVSVQRRDGGQPLVFYDGQFDHLAGQERG